MKLKIDGPIAAAATADAQDNGLVLLRLDTVMGLHGPDREMTASHQANLLPEHAEQLAKRLVTAARLARKNLKQRQNEAEWEWLTNQGRKDRH
jgi:hypothetical protein